MLKVTYLSHSSFLIDNGAYKVIIDPYISGNPNAPLGLGEIDADYIVLTHAHGDHLGDAIQLAKSKKATVIAVNELANYAASQGVKAHNMHIGGGHNFPFGRLKFTIAHHGSSTPDGRYMGEPAGVIISSEGKNIYHAGDTGLFLDMKLIGGMYNIDLFLCPIGDNFTMGIDDAVKAAEFVKSKLTVPIHYNTFPAIEADPQEFVRKCESAGIKAMEMNFGETIEIH